MSQFTHFDSSGAAVMVDVGEKNATARQATATGKITMSAPCYEAVKAGTAKKGDVLGAARIAGIMATKQTSLLIPLCHPLMINKAAVDFTCLDEENTIQVSCTVGCTGTTGVEMEALTGATVALLTVYDMCKAIDKGMVMSEIYLVEKTGGKSGTYHSERG